MDCNTIVDDWYVHVLFKNKSQKLQTKRLIIVGSSEGRRIVITRVTNIDFDHRVLYTSPNKTYCLGVPRSLTQERILQKFFGFEERPQTFWEWFSGFFTKQNKDI
jgi:hypothetical protein